LTSRLKSTNKKLAAAYLVVGKPAPAYDVLTLMSEQLFAYTDEQIDKALQRAVRECEWLNLKVILDRIPGGRCDDGRPGVELAWTLCPQREDLSTVWTEEAASAFGVARGLLAEGDAIGARMAFKETYPNLVTAARAANRPVKWIVSLGWDKSDRVRALSEAIERKLITAQHAMGLLAPEQQDELRLALPPSERKQLPPAPGKPQLPEGLGRVLQEWPEDKRPPVIRARPEPTDEERAAHVKRIREQAARLKASIDAPR
jgi:hypothetical protein